MRVHNVFMASLLAGCASTSIRTDFEGGNLQKVQKLDDGHFVGAVAGQADEKGRNRQPSWFYFRADHVRAPVEVRLTELAGEYDYKPAWDFDGGYRPFYSHDGQRWQMFPDSNITFDKEKKEATLRLPVPTEKGPVWVARLEPYTPSRLRRFLDEVRTPYMTEEAIGKTVEGRDMLLLTITNPGVPEADKKGVWLMVRQHAWESGTSFVGEGAIRFLLSPEAAALRDTTIFKILPMNDPDGCFHGGVRFNRHGYDLNRNWDLDDPVKMPEIASTKKAMTDWVQAGRPFDIFVTLHNNPRDWTGVGAPEFADLAQRFFKALVAETPFDGVGGARAPAAAPPAKGRTNVYGWVSRMLKKPGFIIELGGHKNEKLGRWPDADLWREFGRKLMPVMAAIVRP